MIDKFQELEKLGAGEFEHLDGSLIDHLKGTRDLLKKWNASVELQEAGLYHAAYGTAGFDQAFVSIELRSKIGNILGKAAEEIVYQYCACNRNSFFGQFGKQLNLNFPNRFTGKSYELSSNMLKAFCELTAANEIEIAVGNSQFINEHGSGLRALFKNMAPYLSSAAVGKVNSVFGGCNA